MVPRRVVVVVMVVVVMGMDRTFVDGGVSDSLSAPPRCEIDGWPWQDRQQR